MRSLTSIMLIALALGSNAHGATNALKTRIEAPRKLTLSAGVTAQSTLHEINSYERQANTILSMGASYPITEFWRGSLTNYVIQGLDEEKKTNIGNSKLGFQRAAIKASEDSKLIFAIGITLPTNVEDRKNNSFNGAASFAPSFSTQWSPGGVAFSTSYGLSLTKNSHYWDRSSNGGANISYSITNSLGVSANLTKSISFGIDGAYTYARTYQDAMRTMFTLEQSLTYSGKYWSFTLGHSNGGDALLASGRDYNVSVFDEQSSMIFFSTRVAY